MKKQASIPRREDVDTSAGPDAWLSRRCILDSSHDSITHILGLVDGYHKLSMIVGLILGKTNLIAERKGQDIA
jgi:hypothetical protein